MKLALLSSGLICMLIAVPLAASAAEPDTAPPPLPPITSGPFKPSWESLTNYVCPDWFRDAKFGIWAHWGPQCEPEAGDWYARNMYTEGSRQYKQHLERYGHPSTNGFKDIIHEWKAANFDPDKLMSFYKANGAKYFMALANHHDNFDNFNSKYQPWNAVNLGPQRDLIGAWSRAARKLGLRFAVSVHGSRAWSWYEVAQRADKTGPLAGVPYDGKLTKADGKGLWWDGYDPQELYAQNHAPGKKLDWDWDPAKGSSTPDAAYCLKYFLRTKQLWDDYKPDMIYFDDSVLPFHGVTDEYGLNLVAHFYNSSIREHGRNEAVVNLKKLDEFQRRAVLYDIERGKAEAILPLPWQTDTCIGQWHYNREVFEKHQYKTASTVVPMLADIVSKNGNLMLSVPVCHDGTIDEDEVATVSGIGAWLKVNGEAIYATRPWKIYGEGPSTVAAEKGQFGGQRDTQNTPFAPEDIRFTQSKNGKAVYAILLAWPSDGTVIVKSLSSNSPYCSGEISSVRLLGAREKLKFTRDASGLNITLPVKPPCEIAFALKIAL
jgi:alpha-L-fucosidase